MRTSFILLAQYDGLAVIPIEWVCRDYFRHLSPEKLLRKIRSGEISMPIVRMDESQKTAKGVHLTDLASYIDACAERARKELRNLTPQR